MTRWLLIMLTAAGCSNVGVAPPPDHDLRFARRHAPDGPAEAKRCATCHGPDPCARCHRLRPPLDHDPAWAGPAHGLHAALAPTRCAQCHDRAICVSCHR